MKRLLLSLVLVVSAIVSYASDYNYLIVQNNSGEETTYVLSGLVISMNEGTLKFTNAEVKDVTISISDVKKMYFAETSAINSIFANGQEGVVVYDLSGKVVGTYTSREAMESVLGKGLYIIKTQNGVTKEILK